MTIETKFNIGDEVWVFYGNKACHGKIKDVTITLRGRDRQVMRASYEVNFKLGGASYFHALAEGIIFKTKEELIESLFN